MDKGERQERARDILLDLYKNRFVETIYNTSNKKHQEEGWILKSGAWSPWYFNLRPVGSCPRIVSDIAYVMNYLIQDEVPGLTQIMGVEMAGVPLVSVIATASGPGCRFIPYSYTRALPGEKARTPEEAKSRLEEMKIDFGYGGKDLVEGRFEDRDNICIVDDMVTTFGSKLIARYILEYELKGRGIKDVAIEHVAVVLDREQGAEEEAKKQGMYLHSLIKFKTHGLNWLKDIMIPQEHELLCIYQADPKVYDFIGPKRNALAKAKKFRETKR